MDIYANIVKYMRQCRDEGRLPLKTRVVADAMDLNIYQARKYLENLTSAQVVYQIKKGRGCSTLWSLK